MPEPVAEIQRTPEAYRARGARLYVPATFFAPSRDDTNAQGIVGARLRMTCAEFLAAPADVAMGAIRAAISGAIPVDARSSPVNSRMSRDYEPAARDAWVRLQWDLVRASCTPHAVQPRRGPPAQPVGAGATAPNATLADALAREFDARLGGDWGLKARSTGAPDPSGALSSLGLTADAWRALPGYRRRALVVGLGGDPVAAMDALDRHAAGGPRWLGLVAGSAAVVGVLCVVGRALAGPRPRGNPGEEPVDAKEWSRARAYDMARAAERAAKLADAAASDVASGDLRDMTLRLGDMGAELLELDYLSGLERAGPSYEAQWSESYEPRIAGEKEYFALVASRFDNPRAYLSAGLGALGGVSAAERAAAGELRTAADEMRAAAKGFWMHRVWVGYTAMRPARGRVDDALAGLGMRGPGVMFRSVVDATPLGWEDVIAEVRAEIAADAVPAGFSLAALEESEAAGELNDEGVAALARLRGVRKNPTGVPLVGETDEFPGLQDGTSDEFSGELIGEFAEDAWRDETSGRYAALGTGLLGEMERDTKGMAAELRSGNLPAFYEKAARLARSRAAWVYAQGLAMQPSRGYAGSKTEDLSRQYALTQEESRAEHEERAVLAERYFRAKAALARRTYVPFQGHDPRYKKAALALDKASSAYRDAGAWSAQRDLPNATRLFDDGRANVGLALYELGHKDASNVWSGYLSRTDVNVRRSVDAVERNVNAGEHAEGPGGEDELAELEAAEAADDLSEWGVARLAELRAARKR